MNFSFSLQDIQVVDSIDATLVLLVLAQYHLYEEHFRKVLFVRTESFLFRHRFFLAGRVRISALGGQNRPKMKFSKFF